VARMQLNNRRTFIVAAALAVTGCSGSQVSSLPVAAAPSHPVRAIAMAPSGGLLADAVAVELSNRGYTVIDGADTSRMLVRLNLTEVEIAQPEGLARLRAQGLDAVLSVRAAAGYDGQPQSAAARVNSTHTGRVLAGVNWQNGWGGMPGSPADRTMRSGLVNAARQIVDAITPNLRQA
jgi:hypothetical protein